MIKNQDDSNTSSHSAGQDCIPNGRSVVSISSSWISNRIPNQLGRSLFTRNCLRFLVRLYWDPSYKSFVGHSSEVWWPRAAVSLLAFSRELHGAAMLIGLHCSPFISLTLPRVPVDARRHLALLDYFNILTIFSANSVVVYWPYLKWRWWFINKIVHWTWLPVIVRCCMSRIVHGFLKRSMQVLLLLWCGVLCVRWH